MGSRLLAHPLSGNLNVWGQIFEESENFPFQATEQPGLQEMLGASASALPSETEVLEDFFGSSLLEGPSLMTLRAQGCARHCSSCLCEFTFGRGGSAVTITAP